MLKLDCDETFIYDSIPWHVTSTKTKITYNNNRYVVFELINYYSKLLPQYFLTDTKKGGGF